MLGIILFFFSNLICLSLLLYMIIAYLLSTYLPPHMLNSCFTSRHFTTAMPSIVWSVGNAQCFSKIALVVRP